ncbi:adenylate kinase family protein [Candidatus Methanoperedens nitratireducens]|uniref:Putative adenylate kinase n=1 Tax=Candidatus Methanoperedens nitratireducens TaxID=1392998 RepID=A0A284VSJ4_9EURY|nr:adenylate kinase family protein [Candidatus Methanoperedens nitroreducens]SNQ62260.1 putative adenylate kinase [Candidatus Methanoperedens nitroreducens]
MIIALTGTPGTGKTTVCGFIAEHSQYRKQYRIIDLNKLVIDEKLYTEKDEERNSYNADLEKLEERVKLVISQAPADVDIIMESHLSHYLPADAIVVLRANPVALRKRLGKRKEYSFEKVKENANAEALDVILVESVEMSKNVFEINTTDVTPLAVVKSVISIIGSLKNGKTPEDFLPGKINWIELMEL